MANPAAHTEALDWAAKAADEFLSDREVFWEHSTCVSLALLILRHYLDSRGVVLPEST